MALGRYKCRVCNSILVHKINWWKGVRKYIFVFTAFVTRRNCSRNICETNERKMHSKVIRCTVYTTQTIASRETNFLSHSIRLFSNRKFIQPKLQQSNSVLFGVDTMRSWRDGRIMHSDNKYLNKIRCARTSDALAFTFSANEKRAKMSGFPFDIGVCFELSLTKREEAVNGLTGGEWLIQAAATYSCASVFFRPARSGKIS